VSADIHQPMLSWKQFLNVLHKAGAKYLENYFLTQKYDNHHILP
jgi:hypothetical protein